MQPRRPPTLPADAPTTSRPHQMASDPSLDPSRHKGNAPARVSYPEGVDPAPQLRVDLGDPRLRRLGPVASEHLLELLQQRRALLLLRRILRPPTPPE